MVYLKVGDRVRQVRGDDRDGQVRPLVNGWPSGTVVEIDGTGKPTIRWDDNTYTSLPGGWLAKTDDRSASA